MARPKLGKPPKVVGDIESRLGSVRLDSTVALAEVSSAYGQWYLRQRRRFGWDLIVESGDGQTVGWYTARRWLPGGKISLVDGTQGDLRLVGVSRWAVTNTQSAERVAEFRAPGLLSSRELEVSLWRTPSDGFSNLLVLTALAVLMLRAKLARETSGSPEGLA